MDKEIIKLVFISVMIIVLVYCLVKNKNDDDIHPEVN